MITKNDVKYIPALSRIHVSDDKLEGMTKSLADIVTYVEQLQSLDVKDVLPTTYAVPLANALRDDVVTPSLDYKPVFKVPLVIE